MLTTSKSIPATDMYSRLDTRYKYVRLTNTYEESFATTKTTTGCLFVVKAPCNIFTFCLPLGNWVKFNVIAIDCQCLPNVGRRIGERGGVRERVCVDLLHAAFT